MKLNNYLLLASLGAVIQAAQFRLKITSSTNSTLDGRYLVPLDEGDNFYVGYALEKHNAVNYCLDNGRLVWTDKDASALITEMGSEYNTFFQFNTTDGAQTSDEFSFTDDNKLMFDNISGKFLACDDYQLSDYLPVQHGQPAVINYYPTGPGHDLCHPISIEKEDC
ncbi:hypothetical protein TRICI_004923 [Trichomonascus ciferrii]|uniref:Uncharacterized protein n=1 Tax=Trichomonascus ciferrii TaxID=44093 RepID=A0A642UY57_9ASCO|nr:hypothetical protein TRICI_004923 [Trichomonascus ciferrii]